MPKLGRDATRPSDTAVELTAVTKYFDQVRASGLFHREKVRVTALRDVSVSLREGEFAAYAGPNGAGKSTTFKLLCGMLAPQSGMVRVFGLDPIKDRVQIMKRTGVLFGNRSELWWDHPVEASFEWKKAVWNIPDPDYKRALGMATELLDLKEFMKSFARELSLGQRMRADLGLMLLHGPSLVLLDEPTLGLDVLAKRRMIEYLKRINREDGVTILVTSHDLDDLNEMAKRIILINRGAIAFDGTYSDLNRLLGDKRSVRLSAPGAAPALPGARLLKAEGQNFTYEYDAERTPIPVLMRAIADIPGVYDVETGRAPIEQVIAGLYGKWNAKE